MKTKLLAILFTSLSFAPLAHAQEAPAATAEPRHRLVGVILSTSQALLWDDESGEYQLRRVGEDLLGGRIIAMEEDVVILERGEVREEIGISTPPQRRVAARRSQRLPAMIIQVAPGSEAAALAPLAPQPAAPPQPPLPAAPALPMLPPSPSLAPAPQAAPPPVVPPALPPLLPPAAAPAARPAGRPAGQGIEPGGGPGIEPGGGPGTPPLPAAVPADPRGAGPVAPALLLSRSQLERELGALGGPEGAVMLAANPQGGFRITALRAGSLAEAIGMRAGDVVLRIDGRPINGIGDAASAYAWLRLTDQFTIDVVRDGRVMTLRYAFTT